LHTNSFLAIQKILEPNKGGIRKLPGISIKNSSTGEIIYTPPEGEDIIRQLLTNYEQYFTMGGKEYTHIINPKTGSPADSGLSSVTVIAPDCLTADALATAIFVLGKEKGEALAEKYPGVHVEFIEDETR